MQGSIVSNSEGSSSWTRKPRNPSRPRRTRHQHGSWADVKSQGVYWINSKWRLRIVHKYSQVPEETQWPTGSMSQPDCYVSQSSNSSQSSTNTIQGKHNRTSEAPRIKSFRVFIPSSGQSTVRAKSNYFTWSWEHRYRKEPHVNK